MESWIMDARYAARRLLRRPLYAILSVLTLALGIGGTAAVYAIARPILLDPLPYSAEQGLAAFWLPYSWSEQEFLFLRGKFPGFSNVAAYRNDNVLMDRGDGETRLLSTLASSAELFSVLGAAPAFGRGFEKGDDREWGRAHCGPFLWALAGARGRSQGHRPTAQDRWRATNGRRRDAGRVLVPRSDGSPVDSAAAQPGEPIGNYTFIGRLAPNMRVDTMGGPIAEFVRILKSGSLSRRSGTRRSRRVLTPLRNYLVGSLRPALVATFVAMGLILLIACANVAALMLGQVEGRTTELAVRSALGANRVRLTQQLMAEAVISGCRRGWRCVARGWRLPRARVGAPTRRVGRERIAQLDGLRRGDGRGRRRGCAHRDRAECCHVARRPARDTRRLTHRRHRRARWATRRLSRRRRGGACCRDGGRRAGLLIRSVTKLYAIDPGVDTRSVGVVDVALPTNLPVERQRQALAEVTAALRTIPGVTTVGATQKLPLRGGG